MNRYHVREAGQCCRAARGGAGVIVKAQRSGLLVFNERLHDRQEVLVDGKPAPKYVADAIWPAALVPAGEHEVVLQWKRSWHVLGMSVLASLAVTLWALIDKAKHWRIWRDLTALRCAE